MEWIMVFTWQHITIGRLGDGWRLKHICKFHGKSHTHWCASKARVVQGGMWNLLCESARSTDLSWSPKAFLRPTPIRSIPYRKSASPPKRLPPTCVQSILNSALGSPPPRRESLCPAMACCPRRCVPSSKTTIPEFIPPLAIAMPALAPRIGNEADARWDVPWGSACVTAIEVSSLLL
jgi:hypothetical protein